MKNLPYYLFRAFILLCLFCTTLVSEGQTWAEKSPMPTPRGYLSAVELDGKIYVIGGVTSSSYTTVNINEMYDPVSDTWTTKAPMPTSRSLVSLAAVNGKIYAIGGSKNAFIYTKNEEYDPVTDTWTTKASMPSARCGAGVAVVNNKIYVIGGHPGYGHTNVNQEYDPATNSWATKTPMPTSRAYLGATVIDNKIYAVGGISGPIPGWYNVSTNEEYDPATNTWTSKTSMSTSRHQVSVTAVNGKIYVIGGWTGSLGSVLNINEEYDPNDDSWTTVTPMPTARLATGAVANGKIYLIGGFCPSAQYGTDVNEEYTPVTQFETQEYILDYGYQFVSTRIIPENPDMLIVLENILNDNLDFVRNSNGQTLLKIGTNWVNNIGDWITTQGYLFKMNDTDEFSITGEVINPQTPIDLSTGYQFVSYLPAFSEDALIAFESILNDNLHYIRNSEGEVLRKIGPNWVNGLGDVAPGEGYLIKMFSDDILIYPVVSGNKNHSNKKVYPVHFDFAGGNAADPVYTMYIDGLEIGDEVAAYDGEKLVGSMLISSGNVYENELAIFSTLTDKKGYTQGNPISLKVWSKDEIVNTDFTMDAVFDSYVADIYPDKDGEYSLVNVTKISIMNEEIIVYPNPATDLINIKCTDTSIDILNVKVTDITGRVVFQETGHKAIGQIDISNIKNGVYFVIIKTTAGIYNEKIIVR